MWIHEKCEKIEEIHTNERERATYKIVKQRNGGFKGMTESARAVTDSAE